MDLSVLDKKYFIDSEVYNCPFCKRNNVCYSWIGDFRFNWSEDKECFGYLVKCSSCKKISLHLSYHDLRANNYTFKISSNNNIFTTKNIDNYIFYSRPSSFFILDNRIPERIRNLVFEAEQSRQANLLVSASACLRKSIYELLRHERSIVPNKKTGHADYQKSIKNLKDKFIGVSPELFDVLSNIQEVTSDPLHEGSWKEWSSPKLRFLIELVKLTLDEIYVVPDERKKRLGVLNQFKNKFEKDKKKVKT